MNIFIRTMKGGGSRKVGSTSFTVFSFCLFKNFFERCFYDG
ncbi:hypothetical protein [Deferribacter desulfuricans]|nr:hypothetical protein [Deferribacter desulfuricans]